MKKKKKFKTLSKQRSGPLPFGMQPTRVVSKSHRRKEKPSSTFTPMETGQPDQDRLPDIDNPRAAQGGRGPLNQEGEGERQNSQLAALEQIEPEL